MPAVMMPGQPVADAVFVDLEPRIAKLLESGHAVGLGTILVGSDGASAGYIRMKQEKAESLGMAARTSTWGTTPPRLRCSTRSGR